MANEIRVLIAEDDTNTHEEWGESLAAWRFRSEIADDGVKALELIGSFNPHILVSDLRMPRKNGLELLREIRELGIHLPAIMISGQGEIPDAVEALKLGAIDYLRKPVDPAHLERVLRNIADNINIREENSTLRRRLSDVGELGPLFGRSLPMRRAITAMKPELQAKVLRVIEEGRVRRVGGTTEIPLDVRVLAASNRDIEQSVRDGKLRNDLFYRLNVFTIQLPPLRERSEDMSQLIQMFVSHYAEQNKKDVVGVDEECMKALLAHPWPGNVRQLRNVLERALIVCDGRMIRKSDLPDDFRAANTNDGSFIKIPIGSSLEDVEKEMISRTIEFTGGNKTRAAEILGVSAKTLYNKLERFGPER